LKEARVSKGYTLEQVEKATKIRSKFLTAIESDDYARLPSPLYAKGFVKNYGDFLGLESSRMLAFFRRQTKQRTIQ
ncbi:MAG: transcription regulation protein, partial [Parcubacteria group bacterium Gr01-1014_107]